MTRSTINRIRKLLTRPIPVVLLTCLIWVYADQRITDTTQQTLRIRLAAQTSTVIPVLEEPNPGQTELDLQVTLSGQRSRLEKLRKELAAAAPLTYAVEVDDPERTHIVTNTRKIVEQLLARKSQAISVDEVSPREIRIVLDRWITRPLPVTVDVGTVKTTKPVITPEQVQVTLKKSVFDRLAPEDRVIRVEIEDALRNRPDRQVNEDFPIRRTLTGQGINTKPSTVNVQLEIVGQSTTRKFTFSRVKVMTPIKLQENYRVEIDDQKIVVTFRGPVSVMQNLKKENIVPYIQIQDDDRDRRKFLLRAVQFVLPDENIEVVSENIQVNFKIVERPAAPK